MVSKVDFGDGSQFWDCPRLCIGTKPLNEPRPAKIKKNKKAVAAKQEPQGIEIPSDLNLEQLLEIETVLRKVIYEDKEPAARPQSGGVYSTEAYESDQADQAEKVESLNAGVPKKADTNMSAGGGLPTGHALRLWSFGKSGKCVFCDRDADLAPNGHPGKFCWIHDDALWKSARDDADAARRKEFLVRVLILIVLLAAVACALLACGTAPWLG